LRIRQKILSPKELSRSKSLGNWTPLIITKIPYLLENHD
jgi:hypothetical protein